MLDLNYAFTLVIVVALVAIAVNKDKLAEKAMEIIRRMMK